jgi:hypothetical protein
MGLSINLRLDFSWRPPNREPAGPTVRAVFESARSGLPPCTPTSHARVVTRCCRLRRPMPFRDSPARGSTLQRRAPNPRQCPAAASVPQRTTPQCNQLAAIHRSHQRASAHPLPQNRSIFRPPRTKRISPVARCRTFRSKAAPRVPGGAPLPKILATTPSANLPARRGQERSLAGFSN